MDPKDERLKKLHEFLAGNENQPKEEVLRELQSRGVDTKRFFQRVQETVEKAYSEQLRALATKEQQAQSRPSFLAHLADMTREAMVDWLERMQGGELGGEYQEAALARCRNKDAAEFSDDELRSWLEDVGEILGEPKR